MDKIFDKFIQVQTKKSRLGRGLGLTFCRMVVESHNGKIWAESELGKGSIFFLALPAKRKK
ncbi:MAG: hypothetical protein HY810_03915 [Candidatus Omnitrophica bacterium]|nr:hypothetical protein [Candidatus Omnitrophota bacterium]